MKHLLAGFFISVALWSPLQAERITLRCVDVTPHDLKMPNLEINFDTTRSNASVAFDRGRSRNVRLLSESSNHIAWIFEGNEGGGHGITVYLLDRSSMILNLSSVAIGQINYFRDNGELLHFQSLFQCTRPL